jgi:hypothetical protein
MDAVIYTGITQSPRTISGFSFEPDFVWVKNRSISAGHYLWDSVRGTDANLRSDGTFDEASVSAASNGIISTNASDGFIVKDGITSGSNVGSSGSNAYVAWCWDAGSSTVTNEEGSITSQVRANASAGFSVVTFTSPTGTGNFSVGHGLGVTPEFVIVKSRNAVGVWYVYHKSLATDYYLRLNGTDAAATNGVQWGAGMTSSVIGLRAGYSTVGGATTVAYAWTPVDGYSSFGSYTGNGSADGPFVYTGFRPRWILIKLADSLSTYPWEIYDTARSEYNAMNVTLAPNTSTSESGQPYPGLIDATSNGFKIRSANATSYINYPAGNYIYAAFAEHPFSLARAR